MENNIRHKILILTLALMINVFLFGLFGAKPALAGSAMLSWRANPESDLGGYKIYYGLLPRNSGCPPGGYTDSVDVGKAATYTFTNLSDGKTYYFSLTAYDIYRNESCFSAEIQKTTPQKKLSWYETINRFFQSIFSPLSVIFPRIF